MEELSGFLGKRNYITGSYNTGNVSGGNYVGGIAGYTSVAKAREYIYNSYNKGDITASLTNSSAGGIVGDAEGTHVYYCVNTSNQITAQKYFGNIFGYGTGSGGGVYAKAFYCYYNGDIPASGYAYAQINSSEAFTGEVDKNKMLETLNTELSQVEWNGNTVDVWKMTSDNDGYPILYWE